MAEQRYRVIDRLESGGMAEVFRGEAVSVQGFKKMVAIKRVLPHLVQNKNFIAMFLDEARLGARLNHANIVSVFDIGAADNTYFIVMEYIDGANLKALVEALRRKNIQFPLKDAIYICMEACRGLSYAHELTDDDGRSLGLVHRDISPPNIMISRRGEVKVTDFGLAKATTQLEKTDPGIVKGKFGYLSPEAAFGRPVDARADVFAVGIVLWELLAGRRLFQGETDYETVKLVQQAVIPSLQDSRPDLDPQFEEIVKRALALDLNTRYQTAGELADALAGYLFSHQMKVTPYDIAHLVKTHTVERPKPRRAAPEPSVIDRLIKEELLAFTSLEDMSDPLNPGTRGDGGKIIDFSHYENPSDWFRDDAEVAAAIEAHGESAGFDSIAPPPGLDTQLTDTRAAFTSEEAELATGPEDTDATVMMDRDATTGIPVAMMDNAPAFTSEAPTQNRVPVAVSVKPLTKKKEAKKKPPATPSSKEPTKVDAAVVESKPAVQPPSAPDRRVPVKAVAAETANSADTTSRNTTARASGRLVATTLVVAILAAAGWFILKHYGLV